MTNSCSEDASASTLTIESFADTLPMIVDYDDELVTSLATATTLRTEVASTSPMIIDRDDNLMEVQADDDDSIESSPMVITSAANLCAEVASTFTNDERQRRRSHQRSSD